MKKSLLAFAVLCFTAVPAFSAPIDIVSYDVTNAGRTSSIEGTTINGYGWSHTYDGVITQNPDGTYNYSGGSGTLNDGKIGTSPYDTQHFKVGDETVITLYLGTRAILSELELYSFRDGINWIPGNIVGLNVTINGLTEFIETTAFGPAAREPDGGGYVHERLSFAGTSLEGLVTDTVILSGVVAVGSFSGAYGISEVMAYGEPVTAAVPEPAGALLLGVGLLGLGMIRRRKQ